MRILYVWDADYPWDVRTEKVCRALVDGGHEVVITARNRKRGKQTERLPEGLVERLPAGPVWASRYWSFPAFFNPVWLIHLRRLIGRHRTELVMVRDLPLAPAALLITPRGIPVVLDMAENYPAMIRDIWTDGRQRWWDILIRNPSLVAMIEQVVVRHLHHVVTVVEESRARVVRLGAPPSRTSVVSNTPAVARISARRPRDAGKPLRLVYLGLMEIHRGVDCLLEAIALVKQRGSTVHLDLIGDGRDFEEFVRRAAALGLTASDVTFHGRLGQSEALALLGQSHVGMVPHEARESWNTTIPNKLFDYMAAGLAVVTSNAVPAARVVTATGAGQVFESGNAESLARCIEGCVDLAAWEAFRQAGQTAIRTTYNWGADSERLLGVVASFSSRDSA